MGRRRKNYLLSAARGIALPLLILAVLLVFFTGISNLRGGSDSESRRQLEESIRRTAAACYAAEGIYPPTLEYMEDHYGLQVDTERYTVDYRIFASNLMPDFTVLEKSEE